MTLTIKTLPHYFPEVFAQRVILSVLVFLALCVVIVLLYKCLKIDKLQRNASIILSRCMLLFCCISRLSGGTPMRSMKIGYIFTIPTGV